MRFSAVLALSIVFYNDQPAVDAFIAPPTGPNNLKPLFRGVRDASTTFLMSGYPNGLGSGSNNSRRQSSSGKAKQSNTQRPGTKRKTSTSARALKSPDVDVIDRRRQPSGQGQRTPQPRIINMKEFKSESLKPRDRKKNTTTRKTRKSSVTLTREQEAKISHHIRGMRYAIWVRDNLYMKKKAKMIEENCFDEKTVEPTEEEWAAGCGIDVMVLRKVMHFGHAGLARLVASNQVLVNMVARKHYRVLMGYTAGIGTILTLQDLIQEGNLGILKAAEKFDPSKGCRFSTYAIYWVRRSVMQSIADSSRTIRLPVHVHSVLMKVWRTTSEFKMKYGNEPSVGDLSDILEIPAPKLEKYMKAGQSMTSLDVTAYNHNSMKDNSEIMVAETIAATTLSPDEEVLRISMKEDVRAVLEELRERERQVLVLRYGLDDGQTKSVEKTATLMGISRDRVRTLEARALNKLRNPRHNAKLKDYVDGYTPVTETKPDLLMQELKPESTPEYELSSSSSDSIWSF